MGGRRGRTATVDPVPGRRTLAVLVASAVVLGGCTSMLTGAGGPSAGRPIGKDDRSAATLSRDGQITKTIRARYAADPDLGAASLIVETRNGFVTLKGTVGSYEDRDRAVRLARDVDGVARVYNQIAVRTR